MEYTHRPVPANEAQRLELLRSYAILDTLPEKQFDDLTLLASIICEAPITLISLVDEKRLWFKSKIGTSLPQKPREMSVCQYAIMGNEIFEVENSLEDERFAQNPLVTGPPNIRFYAGAPLRSAEGYNLGTLCVFDIKPRKLSENQRKALTILANEVVANMELRKERNSMEKEKHVAVDAHDLLHTFLENSPSMITMKDLDGKITYANSPALEAYGKTREEVIGQSSYKLLAPEMAGQVREEDHKAMLTQKTQLHQYEVTENGKSCYYTRHVFPLLNKQCNVTGVGTIVNDVTDSYLLENELEISNRRFASLFYSSPISMMITDAETGRFVMANNTFLHTFGYSREEIIGQNADSLTLIADDKDRHLLGFELQAKGSVRDREFRLLKKNGEPFVALCSLDMVQTDGKTQIISAFQDITERKKIEIQMQEAQKEAEAATHSKSLFLANMSHEIRTPLNAMLGFAELMGRTNLTQKQNEYLDIIEASGKNLLSIINDILDFSKIEAGMMTIEKTPFSPQQILHSVFTMFSTKAESKGLLLTSSIDPQTPSLVIGDPTRLNQVMVNLIGNAIKFTGEGSVKVDCSVQLLAADKCTLRISVKDTGIGITQNKLNHIFDRFTQAEDNINRNFGGTGLGLSIAKRLLELQGGEISVISEPGNGSEFFFTIEYNVSNSKAYVHSESTLPQAKNSFSGRRILLVEDNILNQKLAIALLRGEGFEIEVAENGQRALEILAGQVFDIILMDIQMPILDGYQTTEKIRVDLKLTTPIIAMTANAMTGEQEHCLAVGMDDYITKPFKSEILLQKIGHFLNTPQQ